MESPLSSVDPITFEILSHRLHQIAKEMGTTLERVGGTVNTTQEHDYMASLYRGGGDILSAGESTGWHVACAGFSVKKIIERFEKEEGIYADDIFLLNDPYVTAIHQSDVYMVSPIHYKDRLVAWSATFVHVMDIGAMSPGGNSPGATEIYHEGIRIPGVKLVERGKLRRDVFDTIINMTRQPVMVGLDLKCEIAANNVAKSRMQEMYRQYGPELIDAVSRDMIQYSETILKRRVREIPDGVWKDTAVIQADETWKTVLTLRKEADRLVFDFSGTDKQAKTGINLPYHATFGACFEAVLSTLAYDIPKNHGLLAPLHVVAPEGTLVHVRPPGPVSMNTTSGGRTVKYLAKSVLNQMLSTTEKWRQEVNALSVGGRAARHAGVNQYGRYYVSGFALVLGGSGARANRDGIDSGMEGPHSCPNVEWVELNFPLLHLFRRHARDTAGPGRLRGGTGVETAVTVHEAPERKVKIITYGVAGLKNSGIGIYGGYRGAPSIAVSMEGTAVNRLLAQNQCPTEIAELGGDTRLLPYCDFDLKEGDVFYLRTQSGGGYGDPLERDPESVLNDVANGIISERTARDVYAVALLDGGVDLDSAGTESLRNRFRQERLEASLSQAATRIEETEGTSGASYPSPVLGIHEANGETAICCVRCQHSLCVLGWDWRAACLVRFFPPTKAGPTRKELVGHFLLKELYCPACGRLLEAEWVEDTASAAGPS